MDEDDMDEPDEIGFEESTYDELPFEPITERVRIFGAEPAGALAAEDRLPTGQTSEEVGETRSQSLEERYLGFSHLSSEGASDVASTQRVQQSPEARATVGADDPQYHPGEPSGAVPILPHWTDPPTGQVPAVVSRHDDERDDPWASSGPSWREHDHEWDEVGFEPALLADEDTRVGALDETPLAERRPWEFEELSTEQDRQDSEASWWDEQDEPAEGFWAEPTQDATFDTGHREQPATTRIGGTSSARQESGSVKNAEGVMTSISSSPLRASSTAAGAVDVGRHTRRRGAGGPSGERPRGGGGSGAGRNVPVAIATGLGIAVVALACFALGSVSTLVLSTVVVTLAVAEYYAALRRAGRHPATLLGLVATVGVMVSAYVKGVAAVPLVVVLVVVTSMVWYLSGAEKGSAVEGMTTTILGFVWVGLLGSFAALMLAPSQYPHRHGVAFLLGAVVATVGYDVGALALGGWLGRHPLAPRVSPHKTWEGLLGGAILAVVASAGITGEVHPWSPEKAAILGVVVAVIAPIGDLCESLIKRDLGLKDMGSLLPGHGGVLDRVDALLFVLPATYYLVRVLHLG